MSIYIGLSYKTTLIISFQNAVGDRKELKHRAKEYLSQLERLERSLAERDSECAKLVEQIRVANEEADSWRARWESAETKVSVTKDDLDEKDNDLLAEREKVEARDRELSSLRSKLNSAELQVCSSLE